MFSYISKFFTPKFSHLIGMDIGEARFLVSKMNPPYIIQSQNEIGITILIPNRIHVTIDPLTKKIIKINEIG